MITASILLDAASTVWTLYEKQKEHSGENTKYSNISNFTYQRLGAKLIYKRFVNE